MIRNMWSCVVNIVLIACCISFCDSRKSLDKLEKNARRHGRQSRRGVPQKPDLTEFYPRMPLKPSPIMIPLDIQESPDKNLDPDLKPGDEYGLLTMLGDDYDRQFMSLRQPLDMILNPNGTLHYQFKKDRTPEGEMPPEIKMLSGKEIALSKDGPSLRMKFKKRTKTKIQKFLWAYGYCPVRYKWKQLSVRFWPRWIKTGTCDNQRSCSIPAGMTCKPTKMKNIKILRYYCPTATLKTNCQWIKFEYPILDECTCMCDTVNQQQAYNSYL